MPELNVYTPEAAPASWPSASPYAVETTAPLNIGLQITSVSDLRCQSAVPVDPWSTWKYKEQAEKQQDSE